MNVIGQVVEHKSLGRGKICDHKIRERGHILSLISLVTKKNSNSQIFFKNIIRAKDEKFKAYVADLVQKRKI